jgi:hypothetical protein
MFCKINTLFIYVWQELALDAKNSTLLFYYAEQYDKYLWHAACYGAVLYYISRKK